MKKVFLPVTLFLSILTNNCMNSTHRPIDLNVLNKEGFTPLHYGVSSNKIAAVKFLLEKNANPNIAGQTESPVITAIKNNNTDMVSLLLEYNAYCDSKTIEYAKNIGANRIVVQLLLTSPDIRKSLKETLNYA